MKQSTQTEIKKDGKIYKNISSPATSDTQTQITNLVDDNGVLKHSTDGGNTFTDIKTAQGNSNASAIAIETTNRTNADTALQEQITNNDTDISTLRADLTTETTNRTNADNDLQSQINAVSNIANKSVLTTPQTLTDAEKLQARQNIGAGVSGFDGDYNSLSNKPILNTDNATSQTPNASEDMKNTINLHKISKTGALADSIQDSTHRTVTDAEKANWNNPEYSSVQNVPNASTSTAGVIQIATDTEAEAGTNETKAINPKQLLTAIQGLGSVFTLKGSKPSVADLPTTGNNIGDVWYVVDESVGYIWLNDGATDRWEQLGVPIDLSTYMQFSDVINNLTSDNIDKPLSAYQGKLLANNTTKIANSRGGFAGGTNAETEDGGAVGNGASSRGGGAVGRGASTTGFGGAVGMGAYAHDGGAVGSGAKAQGGFSGGYNAQSQVNSIQLGTGTNSTAKTLQVYGDNLYNADTHKLSSALLNAIYPVGALYLSMNETSPATLFGGTWKQLTADAYLKIVTTGASETAQGQTDHTIPVSSMPSHTHTESSWGGTNKFRVDANLNSGNATCVVRQAEGPQAFTENHNRTHGDSANRSSTNAVDVFGLNLEHTHTINATGGGAAYYPGYIGVYVWYRTA